MGECYDRGVGRVGSMTERVNEGKREVLWQRGRESGKGG